LQCDPPAGVTLEWEDDANVRGWSAYTPKLSMNVDSRLGSPVPGTGIWPKEPHSTVFGDTRPSRGDITLALGVNIP